MATLTQHELSTIAGNQRKLENLASTLYDAARLSSDCEGVDDLDTLCSDVKDVAESLRWLLLDLEILSQRAAERGELCDECERPEDECVCEKLCCRKCGEEINEDDVCGDIDSPLCPDCYDEEEEEEDEELD